MPQASSGNVYLHDFDAVDGTLNQYLLNVQLYQQFSCEYRAVTGFRLLSIKSPKLALIEKKPEIASHVENARSHQISVGHPPARYLCKVLQFQLQS